jgi:hypothetical protein
MKKLLLLPLLALFANAGVITSIQSFTDKGISTEKRNLETYGQNPRAYVFTVEAKDGAKTPMQCVIVYTEQDLGEKGPKSTAPVMQCIPLGVK